MSPLEWTASAPWVGCTYCKKAKANDDSGHLKIVLSVSEFGPRPPTLHVRIDLTLQSGVLRSLTGDVTDPGQLSDLEQRLERAFTAVSWDPSSAARYAEDIRREIERDRDAIARAIIEVTEQVVSF